MGIIYMIGGSVIIINIIDISLFFFKILFQYLKQRIEEKNVNTIIKY